MNLTVLENRLEKLTNCMMSISNTLTYFQQLTEKEMAKKEARDNSPKRDLWKEQEERDAKARRVIKRGDRFIVKQDVVIPAVLRQKDSPRTVPAKRELLVKEVDCLSDAYTIKIVLDECGSDGNSYFYDPIILDRDRVRKLIENEFIELIEK